MKFRLFKLFFQAYVPRLQCLSYPIEAFDNLYALCSLVLMKKALGWAMYASSWRSLFRNVDLTSK